MSIPCLSLRAVFLLLVAGVLTAPLRAEEPMLNRAAAVAELRKYNSGLETEPLTSGTNRLKVGCHSHLPDSAFALLAAFPELEELDFISDKVTDASLSHLKQLPKLRVLRINSATITEEGLDALKDLPKLEELLLMRTKLTDKGLTKVQALRGLKSLTLIRLKVTPELIEQLKQFKQLDKIHIGQTDFTDQQQRELTEILPNLSIQWSQSTNRHGLSSGSRPALTGRVSNDFFAWRPMRSQSTGKPMVATDCRLVLLFCRRWAVAV